MKSRRLSFLENWKLTLKFIWKYKGPRIAKIILRKKEDFTSWHQNLLWSYSNQDSDISVRIGTCITGTELNPEITPYMCRQLIFDKALKIISWEKDNLFNKCCWATGYSHTKKQQQPKTCQNPIDLTSHHKQK